MQSRPASHDVAVAVLAGIAGIVGSFAFVGRSPAFVAAPVDQFVVNHVPGAIVTWSIQQLGQTGHLLHWSVTVLLLVLLFGGLVLAGLRVGRRRDRRLVAALVTGGSVAIVTGLLTPNLPSAVGAGLGAGVVVGLGGIVDESPSTIRSRRRVLRGVAGVLGVGVASAFAGLVRSNRRTEPLTEDRDRIDDHLETATERSFDVDGLEPLVSESFYTVDAAPFPPKIDRDAWRLKVSGAVDNRLGLTFEDLRSLPVEHRFVTLRCVGDPLDGDLIDGALWTGVPVSAVLERADPHSDCGCVMLRAEDGYYEEFPLAALEPGLLAFGMNGRTLPSEHGAPVRALVPGHWGEVNVKWLTEIDVLEEEATGYWEKRGWHGTGPVNTVAKLSTKGVRQDGTAYVAGHAYAGTRGIDRVEVSIDGGSTWQAATLSEPLPGDDVWRQWRYGFQPEGSHEVVVRAIDGTGTLQPRERSDAFPSGATGWVRTTFEP